MSAPDSASISETTAHAVVVQCPCSADGTVDGRAVKLLRRKPGGWAEVQFLDTGSLSFCEWWEFKPNSNSTTLVAD
jgi:hypothetical protein